MRVWAKKNKWNFEDICGNVWKREDEERQMEDWLSPAEFAEAMKISKKTVYRLLHAGKLRHRKLGKRIFRIHRSEVGA